MYVFIYSQRASQVTLVVKNPPASAGEVRDQVQFLGREDPLEEGTAMHSCLESPMDREEPGGLQPMGSQKVGHA